MAGGQWFLGVDLGTTYTAAAVRRGDHSEIVTLGSRAAVEPTVVFAAGDEVVVGEAAERRAAGAPGHTVRQFKRRLGDTAPVLLGGVPYSPQALLAAVLADVVERTTTEQGSSPERVTLTHPANWGPYKRELVRQVAELAGLETERVRTITEPAAAAIHYAAQAGLEPGSVVAVYDLGGGTFDAAVVRIEAAGAEVLGEPTGIEHLGGIDVDAAVLGHVRAELGERFEALEAEEHAGLLARLRDECVGAKEALSTDADTVVGVTLPDGYAEVRLVRTELEAMIRPALAPTADALRRAIGSAGLTPDDLAGVLLVGGSSRIPLVSELVSGALGRPVLLDAHPKHSVALGAAAHAAGDRVDDGALPVVVPADPADATAAFRLATALRSGRGRRRAAVAVLVVGALLVGGVAAAQRGSGDPPEDEVATNGEADTTTSSETTSTESTSASTTSTSTTTTTEPGTDGTTRTTVGRGEGTGPGPGPGPGPGTTVPPPGPTTTAPLVAPGAPTNARVSSPVEVSSHANGAPREITVTVTFTPPANQGSGITRYVLTGEMLFQGTGSPIRTVQGQVAGSASSGPVTFVFGTTQGFGLGDGGFIRWRLVAQGPGGSSGPATVAANAPSLVGASTTDAYHLLWSAGVRVFTAIGGGCASETVCAQSASGPMASGGTVTITHP